MPQKSMRDAINDALHAEMARNPSIIVLGEDVSGGAGGTSGQREASGGIFGVTKGLLPKFGADRVIDTPISESAIVGAAAGAALAGLRLLYVFFLVWRNASRDSSKPLFDPWQKIFLPEIPNDHNNGVNWIVICTVVGFQIS